jgi:hypothetical protein
MACLKALQDVAAMFLSRTRLFVELGQPVCPVIFTSEPEGEFEIHGMPLTSESDKDTVADLIDSYRREGRIVIFIGDTWLRGPGSKREALAVRIYGPDINSAGVQPYKREGHRVVWEELKWSDSY